MIKLERLLEKHPDDIDSTSGVIIEHADTILIMKKTEGGYTIPKGHMRMGETPREGMHRELKEETQITLPMEPNFLYKIERPIEKGGNFMYVFHYISDKEYTYKTETEKKLEQLRNKAKEEGYFADISETYDLLDKKIQDNKNDDLEKSKEDIKEILTGEIMSRYYYQRGRIKAGLNFDIEVKKAVEILRDRKKYNQIYYNNQKQKI